MCTDHNRTCAGYVCLCVCMCRDVSEFQIVFTFKVFPTNEGLVSGYKSIFLNNLWSKMDENVNCLTCIPKPNGNNNNNNKNATENLQSKCTFLVFWLLSCFASFPQTSAAAVYQLISFSTNLFTESNDCRLISCIGKLSVCNIKHLMPAYFSDAYELPRCQKTNLHLSNFSSVFFLCTYKESGNWTSAFQPVGNMDAWTLLPEILPMLSKSLAKHFDSCCDLASKLWKVLFLLVLKKRGEDVRAVRCEWMTTKRM